MMRKLVWLVMTVSLVFGVRSARAQIMVMDQGNIAQSITNTTREVSQLTSQLRQLQAQYEMFRNVPRVFRGVFQDFDAAILRNPLPVYEDAASRIAGMVEGTANRYSRIFYEQNRYAVTGPDPVGRSLAQRTDSFANIQGIAAQNLDSIHQRLDRLEEMEGELAAASDVTQVAAINGRIAIENQAIQAQAAAAQNLQMMAQAQMENQRIQEREAARVDENNAASWWKRGE